MFETIIGKTQLKYKMFHWDMTHTCNIKCPYCITHTTSPLGDYSTNWECLTDYFSKINDNSSIVMMMGGEPTTHPHFFDICNSFKTNFGLSTNLIKSQKFYKKLIEYDTFKKVFISIHLHAIPDLEEYFQKIDLFKEKYTFIFLMIEEEYIDIIEDIFYKLKERYPMYIVLIRILDKVFQYKRDISHLKKLNSEEQYYLADGKLLSRFDIVERQLNTENGMFINKPYYCDISKYISKINMKGEIFTCFNTTHMKPITSIYEDISNYNKISKSIICNNTYCNPFLFEFGTKKLLKRS